VVQVIDELGRLKSRQDIFEHNVRKIEKLKRHNKNLKAMENSHRSEIIDYQCKKLLSL